MRLSVESSPLTASRHAWNRLVVGGLALLAVLAVVIQIVNQVLVPPLVVSSAVLGLAAVLVEMGGSSRRRVVAAGVLAVLFVVINLPFAVQDLAHPESFLGFTIAALVLAAAVAAVVSAIVVHRGATVGSPNRLLVGVGLASALALGASAVAALSVESDDRQPGDVDIVAEGGEYPSAAEVVAGGALFVANRDAYRHTFVLEASDIAVELPAGIARRVEIDLSPGSYTYVCDVPGHHMDGTLAVTAATNGTSNEETAMKRTPVNPWTWSLEMAAFNQAELIEGHSRELIVAGQTAMSADGQPQHAGDMAAQLELSLDNLEAVLAAAGMSLSNVVRLNIYTTDVDGMYQHYGTLAERLGAAGVAPPGTLLGVSRLGFPELLVELEATAAD